MLIGFEWEEQVPLEFSESKGAPRPSHSGGLRQRICSLLDKAASAVVGTEEGQAH
jgi:hypothetical protein